jgi:hypothetical protein
MSSSDVAARVATLRDGIEGLLSSGDAASVDPAAVQDLLSAAVRLYSARVDQAGLFPAVARDSITATDAMIATSGLLRAVNIAPFELGLWQAWSS